MTDYFALLEQPRRPWLDPESLKQKYHELARSAHPDQTTPAGDFAELNEAYRVLLDPKLRLQHLLDLEGIPKETGTVPETLADLFPQIGTLIQETDRFLAKATTTALSKAMAQTERLQRQKLTADLLNELQQIQQGAFQELRVIDRDWVSQKKDANQLSELASRFSYLGRWVAQLEERKFRLSI